MVFWEEFFGNFPLPPRCSVATVKEQCPEIALYSIDNDTSRPTLVCEKCLCDIVRLLTKRRPIVVSRLIQ